MTQSHLDLSCLGFEGKKMRLHVLSVKFLPSGPNRKPNFFVI